MKKNSGIKKDFSQSKVISVSRPKKSEEEGGKKTGKGDSVAKPKKGKSLDDSVILWRGFRHKWHYNHRWNRFGDYVKVLSHNGTRARANLVHTSASGIGSDSAWYTSYYYGIAAEEVSFHYDEKEIILEGKENKPIKEPIHVSSTAKGDMKNRTNFRTVLNGFELYSLTEAKKVINFKLKIGKTSYDKSSGKINFDIDIELKMGCSTEDCHSHSPFQGGASSGASSPFEYQHPDQVQEEHEEIQAEYDKVRYKMKVAYVIIGDSHEAVKVTVQEFHNRYKWDADNELEMEPHSHNIKGDDSGSYGAAAIVFKEIELQLDGEHWMYEWWSIINQKDYDGGKGKARLYFDLHLLFKQWAKGMKKIQPFSQRKSGSAHWRVRLAMLQFKDGQVKEGKYKDEMEWEASLGGSDPTAPAAVRQKNVMVDFN